MPQYPPSINLAAFTPSLGYIFRSGASADWFAFSLAHAGDVNGDGFADYLFGAPAHHLRENRPNPPVAEGNTYLVFGGTSLLGTLDAADGSADGRLDLSLMTTANGYRMTFSTVGDASGTAVAAAGEQDGVAGDDLIIGTPRLDNGRATLVSGGANLAVLDAADGAADGTIDLDEVDGTTGYEFIGRAGGDAAGIDVASVGDINGDGDADLLIGAFRADRPGSVNAGEAALVLGGAAKLAALDAADGVVDARISLALLDGTNGYLLQGAVAGDSAGFRARGVKDANGDGIADILVGAYQTPAGSLGEAYLIFGGTASLDALDTAGGAAKDGRLNLVAVNGSTGFRFLSPLDGDQMGLAVSGAGDVNADGVEDLLIGDPFSDPFGSTNAGDAYLVYGGQANLQALDLADGVADGDIDLTLLNGVRGFRISGVSSEWVGQSVAAGGDINGDGYDDILVGANFRAGRQGAVYVLFGGTGLGIEDAADGSADGRIVMSAFSGVGGFRIDGVDPQDQAGFSVAASPDVNGDGMNEILIGSVRDSATVAGAGDGEAYMVFSRLPDASVTRIGTDIAQRIVGGHFTDLLRGLGGDDELRGNNGNDTLDGGTGADTTIGGVGNDDHIVDSLADRVIEAAGGGFDRVLARGDFVLDAASEVEWLIAIGAATPRLLVGNALNNRINGSLAADTIEGGDGVDRLLGRDGADLLVGGTGDDFYYADKFDTVVELAGEGNDRLYASEDFTLGAGIEIEFLIANAGATGLRLQGNELTKVLLGNAGADTLLGGSGTNVMRANDGNDRLDGGDGIDNLTGGAGADTIVLASEAASRDVIRGFASGTDMLEASAAAFGGGLVAGALDPAAFRTNARGLAQDADDRFIYNTANGVLYFDVDGLGGAAREAIALLNGAPALAATDFVIVA